MGVSVSPLGRNSTLWGTGVAVTVTLTGAVRAGAGARPMAASKKAFWAAARAASAPVETWGLELGGRAVGRIGFTSGRL